MTFDPNEYLMKLQNKDYLEVKWRLVWFRDIHPNGTIETEPITIDLDRETEEEVLVWNEEKHRKEKIIKRANGFALFRAVVKNGEGGIGTGTKSEKAASFPDFIEKAESGAIGRALASLGFGTQFTGDELNEHHRIVDSPVERKAQLAPESQKSEQVSSLSTTNGKEMPAPSSDVVEASAEEIKKLLGTVKSLLNAHYQIPQIDQPAKWRSFKELVLGLPVEDEGLSLPELKRLRDAVKMKIQNAKGAA